MKRSKNRLPLPFHEAFFLEMFIFREYYKRIHVPYSCRFIDANYKVTWSMWIHNTLNFNPTLKPTIRLACEPNQIGKKTVCNCFDDGQTATESIGFYVTTFFLLPMKCCRHECNTMLWVTTVNTSDYKFNQLVQLVGFFLSLGINTHFPGKWNSVCRFFGLDFIVEYVVVVDFFVWNLNNFWME